MTKVYECCVLAASLYGGIVHAPNNEGVLLWLPGKHARLRWWQQWEVGMYSLPYYVSSSSLKRLTRHEKECEPYIKKYSGDRMGLIWIVGVASAYQGRGHCRYMMEQAIATMTARGMNEFWLCTDSEVNVTIYSKLGFEIMEEKIVRSSGVKNWVMRRLV